MFRRLSHFSTSLFQPVFHDFQVLRELKRSIERLALISDSVMEVVGLRGFFGTIKPKKLNPEYARVAVTMENLYGSV